MALALRLDLRLSFFVDERAVLLSDFKYHQVKIRFRANCELVLELHPCWEQQIWMSCCYEDMGVSIVSSSELPKMSIEITLRGSRSAVTKFGMWDSLLDEKILLQRKAHTLHS